MGTSPNWTYSYVPTAAQWNAAFAAKQDELGYSPVNRAGDTMLGRFSTFASVTERSGFAIQQGVAPASPVDGDMWVTGAGLYVQISGSTVGPIGPGTLTSVGLTAPTQFAVSNSPLTADGDIGIAWVDQVANVVLAGPATGADAAPTFRALVGADLPDPASSTKGGVKSYAAVANQFLTSIGTDGTPAGAQPAFSDISGQATSAQIASGVAVANLGYTPLNPTNNLSDVASSATARTNIGAAALASPAFTGTPTAPTAAEGTATTQIATTAFANSTGRVIQVVTAVLGADVTTTTATPGVSSGLSITFTPKSSTSNMLIEVFAPCAVQRVAGSVQARSMTFVLKRTAVTIATVTFGSQAASATTDTLTNIGSSAFAAVDPSVGTLAPRTYSIDYYSSIATNVQATIYAAAFMRVTEIGA